MTQPASQLRTLACVDLPDLPLQMVLRAQPALREQPVAVLGEDRPEAPLLWLNDRAHELRLRTGMRFGVAKSLLPELTAKVVSALDVEQMVSSLVRDLQTFSPHVERDPVHAGVFYVDPSGLAHLYGGEASWANCVHRYLKSRGFRAAVVVGPGRVLPYAIARITRGVRVVGDFAHAVALAREVPLDRLHVRPKLRDALDRIGVTTLGDLSVFGVDQLALRFGNEAAYYGRAIHGHDVLPLCAEPHATSVRSELDVEPPDDDLTRLSFAIKSALDRLVEDVRKRGESIRAVWLKLVLERHPTNVQRLEPSSPTRDAQVLLELLRLRMATLTLPGKVSGVLLEAETCALAPGQLSMFVPRRDLSAGERALARLRASFGEDVVCQATLEDAHLPEAKYRFTALTRIVAAQRGGERIEALPLVRRMLKRPERLACTLENTSDESAGNTRAMSLCHGHERWRLQGPYKVNGGWWQRAVARDYYYARADDRSVWWVFFDQVRNAWFRQAQID